MIRILLQSEDAYFTKAFSNYASTHCKSMEFVCFSTAEKALDYLAGSVLRFDAVLATPAVLERVSAAKTTLMEVSDQTVYADPTHIHINIYQSGPAILSDITNALALAGHRIPGTGTNREVCVIAVYSAQGGSGKTALCYALAAASARKGEQALYLNLEPIPAFAQLYRHSFQHQMDELLLALKSGREAAPVLLDTMERNQDRVMVLPPFAFAGDLLSLSEAQLGELLDVLANKTDLQKIFIDLPVGFHPMNLWVMERCSTVIQVYTDSETGRERLQKTREDVYFKNLPIRGALLTVLNQCKTRDAEQGIAGKLPHSDSLQKGCTVAQVQERNPAFLKACNELLDKIV